MILDKIRKNTTLKSDGRLYGGYNISIKEVPYHVGIEIKSVHRCSGFIISRTYVLSAAHCFDEVKSPQEIKVRAGTTYKERDGVLYGVKKFYNHPLYGTKENVYDYDFAILELTRKITYNNNTIAKIELPKQNEKFSDNIVLKVTGWGFTEDGIEHYTLRAVDILKINHKKCYDQYKNTIYKGITPRMFCAGSPGKDACKGDSGGALVRTRSEGRKVAIGITSWGKDCALPEHPGVYAKVSTVRDWIKNITNV
ncbi:trypsin 3A1-like [Phlebotomus papatasi]|uniref:trypsin 3A1-like n=1 Tax=Phlebotomus papatasi TaxID=29031 RepID=UPI0024839985|nr:trypsin 3A1-like [Phlebotomus papatasi]